jgi:hypothetical protein
VKKTIGITILMSVLSLSTLSGYAAVTGGNPRPRMSPWSAVVAAVESFLGV